MNGLSDEEVKNALKAGLQEWLNARLADFGMWSIRTIATLLVGGLVYFFILTNGWRKFIGQ